MNDYVPPLPRIERERITSIELFPGGGIHDVLGDWILTFEGHEWRFTSWAVAVEFVANGWHFSSPKTTSSSNEKDRK